MGRHLDVCTVQGKCNQILCQVNLRLTLNYFLLDFFWIIICLPVASIKCSVASVQKEKKNKNWKKNIAFSIASIDSDEASANTDRLSF